MMPEPDFSYVFLLESFFTVVKGLLKLVALFFLFILEQLIAFPFYFAVMVFCSVITLLRPDEYYTQLFIDTLPKFLLSALVACPFLYFLMHLFEKMDTTTGYADAKVKTVELVADRDRDGEVKDSKEDSWEMILADSLVTNKSPPVICRDYKSQYPYISKKMYDTYRKYKAGRTEAFVTGNDSDVPVTQITEGAAESYDNTLGKKGRGKTMAMIERIAELKKERAVTEYLADHLSTEAMVEVLSAGITGKKKDEAYILVKWLDSKAGVDKKTGKQYLAITVNDNGQLPVKNPSDKKLDKTVIIPVDLAESYINNALKDDKTGDLYLKIPAVKSNWYGAYWIEDSYDKERGYQLRISCPLEGNDYDMDESNLFSTDGFNWNPESGDLITSDSLPEPAAPLEEKCLICNKVLDWSCESEIVRCPSCKAPFHEPHILEWIKMRGSCPVCREKWQFQ